MLHKCPKIEDQSFFTNFCPKYSFLNLFKVARRTERCSYSLLYPRDPKLNHFEPNFFSKNLFEGNITEIFQFLISPKDALTIQIEAERRKNILDTQITQFYIGTVSQNVA